MTKSGVYAVFGVSYRVASERFGLSNFSSERSALMYARSEALMYSYDIVGDYSI